MLLEVLYANLRYTNVFQIIECKVTLASELTVIRTREIDRPWSNAIWDAWCRPTLSPRMLLRWRRQRRIRYELCSLFVLPMSIQKRNQDLCLFVCLSVYLYVSHTVYGVCLIDKYETFRVKDYWIWNKFSLNIDRNLQNMEKSFVFMMHFEISNYLAAVF